MTSAPEIPVPRIAVTPGEPSGIGPDIVVALAAEAWPVDIVVVGDPVLLRDRAAHLGIRIDIARYDPAAAAAASVAGKITVAPHDLGVNSIPGQPDPRNSAYVVETLKTACDGCLSGEFAAMVTAPVQKSTINDAGVPFSGHTEFLAQRCDAPSPVMLLVAGDLRVALVTTHLPLREVADSINTERVTTTTRTLDAALGRWFGLERPRITVLGLNPHAGEAGHLGHEEQQIIEPALQALRDEGLRVDGPLPADTAFTEHHLRRTDAVVAMYHDQGLPILKHRGFGRAVNVTLGLPIIRTSVDHGTALERAGTGDAETGSLRAALELAIHMQTRAAQ